MQDFPAIDFDPSYMRPSEMLACYSRSNGSLLSPVSDCAIFSTAVSVLFV